jgi:hypothetical protein
MKFTVERNWIDVVGNIWQPGVGLCAMRKDLRTYDIENIGKPTRKNVSDWIDKNFGDFQNVVDFHAVIGNKELNWKDEENECVFNDCMYGDN